MPKHRSAKTGRAVSAKEAKANPDTTVRHGKSKDTLRLDWLQKHGYGAGRYAGTWSVNAFVDKSLRAAIDRAMEAEKQG